MKKPKLKIKKGDEVLVIAGKDKGKKGAVLAIRCENNDRVRLVVSGVNLVKKHVRPNPQKNTTGGIQEIEAPIDISNVMLANPATGKGERVGIRILKDGKKTRYFKKSNEDVGVK
jgi:large subunit ribosomal protein L24